MSWDWEKLKEQQHKRNDIPPQIDEFIQKVNNIKFPGGPILILFIIIAALFASSTLYTVEADEVGVVQRFGKYVRTEQPGLNFKFPAGVEMVTKVKVKRIKKEEFGFRSVYMNEKTSVPADEDGTSLMLTGDLNVALVPWIVQYRIRDPYNYLFKVQNVERLLRDMAEAAMRLVIGDRSVNEVISKREEIADEAQIVLQEELNQAETGIDVITIEMKRTNVPEPVQPSFNEVNQATQEKEKLIYEAKKDYNTAIPAAKGDADKTIKTAEGYALDRVNRAKGDADRFKSLYSAYSEAKDVTKKRLYLEMMKDILPNMGQKYIIDADQKNLLPFLNLNKQQEIGVEK